MKPHIFIYIIFSFFISCNSFESEKPRDETTKEVNIFLKSHFSSFLTDTMVYCFIPANQCKNCFIYNGNKTDPFVNNHLIIVSGFSNSNFPNFNHVYYDSLNDMMSLISLDYSNKFIVYKNDSIKSVIQVTDFYRQLDSLISAIDRRPSKSN